MSPRPDGPSLRDMALVMVVFMIGLAALDIFGPQTSRILSSVSPAI